MKKLAIKYILFALGLCLTGGFSSCSDTAGEDWQTPGEGAEVELCLNSGITSARTVLPGPQNVQHVTHVSLYLFEHDNENPADTLGAVCVAAYPFEKINWMQDLENAANGGSSTQRQIVALDYKMDPTKTYTFLAIGSDETFSQNGTANQDNATKTYGLRRTDLIRSGVTTLEECIASLQQDCGMSDIHQSELFAGTLTVSGNDVNKRHTVNLYRRVAAVKGYFKRIPKKVTLTENGVAQEYQAEALHVVYWKKQSTGIYLRKMVDWTNHQFIDYINTERDVCLIPEVGQKFQSDNLNSCSYFTIPKEAFPEEGEGEIPFEEEKVDFATAGSYVLPAQGAVKNETGEYTTMYVVLVDKEQKVLLKKKVVFRESYTSKTRAADDNEGTDGGTGIIIGQPGDQTEQDKEYRYPIVANNFYTIGTAQEPIDLSNGETDVFLKVDPSWEGIHDLNKK